MYKSKVLGLPYISASQSNKHITANEALQSLDILVQMSVLSRQLNEPPADAPVGARYIVGLQASGEWAGKSGWIAAHVEAGWLFFEPEEGWRAYCKDDLAVLLWDLADWQAQSNNGATGGADLTELGINTQADTINRLAVKSDAVLLNHDDVGPGTGDIRLYLNRKDETATASAIFQNAYSGRAEVGLNGGDDFSIKVSEDGTQWTDALRIDRKSGGVSVPFFDSVQIKVGFEEVGVVTPPSTGGIVFLSLVHSTYPQNPTACIMAYDVGNSPLLTTMVPGASVENRGSTALTGTTGTSGKVSLAVDGAGNLYIENRYVGDTVRQFCLTFINSYRAL